MSMQDPISDMLTRIRNAQQARHETVEMEYSKHREAIVQVLRDEGYLIGYEVEEGQPCDRLRITLKYHEEKPVISRLRRVSRPGLRVYRGARDLPWVRGGLGIAVVSTSHGVMSDHKARKGGHGGEIICTVE